MVDETKLLQSENQLNRMRIRQLELSLLNICKDMNTRINELENKVDKLLNELKPVTIKQSRNPEHEIMDHVHGNWKEEL